MSPLEYVVIRDCLERGKKSSVLISEFVGGSRLLTGATKLNPYNIREMVECLENAVNLCSPAEREKNFQSMVNYINAHPIDLWAFRFLKDIKFINQKRKNMIGNEGRQLLNNKLMMEKKKEFLASKEFYKTYKKSNSRLIIIMLKHVKELLLDKGSDDEGDGDSEDFSDTELSDVVLELLQRLSKDPKNKIWIVSADETHKLHDTFYKIPNLGLAAEDGYFYRTKHSTDKNKNDWSRLIINDDCSWLELVRSIMQVF